MVYKPLYSTKTPQEWPQESPLCSNAITRFTHPASTCELRLLLKKKFCSLKKEIKGKGKKGCKPTVIGN